GNKGKKVVDACDVPGGSGTNDHLQIGVETTQRTADAGGASIEHSEEDFPESLMSE
ncbi:hypothetical protein MKX03_033649, partial [Papaver bracteatum]